MKAMICALLFLMPLVSFSQKPTRLFYAEKKDSIENGQAIIYGNFIQRLGFSSGGYSQEILIKHAGSGAEYIFRVKGTFKSAKENVFCYHIPAGKYVILLYQWTQSKWYGGQLNYEPVYKGVSSFQTKKMMKEGTLKAAELQQYEFTVEPNTLNYLGSWNFDQEIVSFSNDKVNIDKEMKATYKKLNFDQAIIALPH